VPPPLVLVLHLCKFNQTREQNFASHNGKIKFKGRTPSGLARDISRIIIQEQPQGWFLAAASEINQAIVQELHPTVRAGIEQNLKLNLTKLPLQEVLIHFYGEETTMAKNKGKPSGKYAETKTSPGRRGDYKRSGWPEDASTQHVDNAAGRQMRARPETRDRGMAGLGRGRNRRAGGEPVARSRTGSGAGTLSTLGLNRSNVRRKPSARRTSPMKQLMRKQKIGPQVARAMRELTDKGDRRRSVAERKVQRRALARVGR